MLEAARRLAETWQEPLVLPAEKMRMVEAAKDVAAAIEEYDQGKA